MPTTLHLLCRRNLWLVSPFQWLPFVQYESSQRVHCTAVYLLATVHVDTVVASTVLLSDEMKWTYLHERTGNCCCCWAMSWSNSSGTFYPGQAYPSKAGKGSGAGSYLIIIMEACDHWACHDLKAFTRCWLTCQVLHRKYQSHENLLWGVYKSFIRLRLPFPKWLSVLPIPEGVFLLETRGESKNSSCIETKHGIVISCTIM